MQTHVQEYVYIYKNMCAYANIYAIADEADFCRNIEVVLHLTTFKYMCMNISHIYICIYIYVYTSHRSSVGRASAR